MVAVTAVALMGVVFAVLVLGGCRVRMRVSMLRV